MKKIITVLSLVLLFLVGNIFAQDRTGTKNQYRKGNTHKVGFVDADGDGYNDNAADHDGDGIPNGQDDDFVRPQDGSGSKKGSGNSDGKGNGRGGNR